MSCENANACGKCKKGISDRIPSSGIFVNLKLDTISRSRAFTVPQYLLPLLTIVLLGESVIPSILFLQKIEIESIPSLPIFIISIFLKENGFVNSLKSEI